VDGVTEYRTGLCNNRRNLIDNTKSLWILENTVIGGYYE
jgi:hypothetical protein